ncbi:concanavalin A-like lectin/glucanase [Hyaloscypha variabilis]|uniref:Concanavalin A-like lectin/glucanase n=1 Tax=Hyaloscypha variabilis (strain UAMH 11265 / GT02V1 / F) TaxID=1149755 RepID=A0A2J6RNY0_HYAVF|nr:concanavalin A-like lectin/glucanase [Hyaloscypha variabilis F]
MYWTAPLSLFAAAIFFASAQASYLSNELSFGHNGNISPNLRAVPNWHLLGKPKAPDILKDKLVLTPPYPGNMRGAVWTEKPLLHSNWAVDVDFRATGPERGGGNLQIWYAKDGQNEVGTSSIYTVGRFDGLALVVDQYAGSAGFIRGFLNDGTTDYSHHHSVDSLAFGHCDYSFRNLGRPSRIMLKQSDSMFRVEVDGNLCFESDKIKLPLGYSFGITAASAENPDSFEIFKFVTTTESHTPDIQDPNSDVQNAGMSSPPPVTNKIPEPNPGTSPNDIPSFSDQPETPASQYQSSAEQFSDLHNRLQAMMRNFNALHNIFNEEKQQAHIRHEELMGHIVRADNSLERIEKMMKKIEEVQADVRQTKSDLHNALDRHVAGLRGEVRSTHSTMLSTVASMGTGLGKFVLVVLGSNGLLVLCYLVYKRRKANMPKKYL